MDRLRHAPTVATFGERKRRLLGSVRLQRLHQRQNAGSISLPWFEALIIALYLTLLYKLVIMGILLMLGAGVCLLKMRERPWPVAGAGLALTIAYAALATLTAFLVSIDAGVARTAQFVLVVAAAAAICKYLSIVDAAVRTRFLIASSAVNGVVLWHVVAYHLSIGRWTTWKYLYDTKFVFSLIVVLVASIEDVLRARGGRPLWYAAFGTIGLIVLLSGERKAYILLLAVFLLTRSRWTTKGLFLLSGAVLVAALLAFAPTSYLARQVSGGRTDAAELNNRYFLSLTNIGDQSDFIRTFVNRNADALFEQHPLLGVGATGYQAWARTVYGDTLAVSHGFSMNVHGERHRVPAENGMLGIAVVAAYLVVTGSRILRFIARRGGIGAASIDRAPLYAFIFLICYVYGEAMDTTMVMTILFVGFMAASLRIDPEWGLLRSERARRALRASARRSDRGLIVEVALAGG